jgi:23S rRNA (pseudouridine1915-N3)-methyltransferase
VKINIIKLGKPAFDEYETLVNVYHKRIAPQLSVQNIILKCNDEKEALVRLEKQLATSGGRLAAGSMLILLDERGEQWDSVAFAGELRSWKDDPRIKVIDVVIGAPYGIPPALKQYATKTWALSRLVFTSDLAWLLVWEQLYRALSILNNTRYHHGD